MGWPLALVLLLVRRKMSCPFLTVATASCWRARRDRKCRSDSLVWSMCCTLRSASSGAMRAGRLLRAAMSCTTAPTVLSFQLWLARSRRLLAMSALRARTLMRSGLPPCSTSSTTKLPLSTRPSCSHPRRMEMVAPLGGMAMRPSASSRVRSSWSASSPRLSRRRNSIRRLPTLGVMLTPLIVS